ncbi:unnamed protein product [Cuscuta europaea]|uniref:DUF7804 domain-containing protein n=1 Tax=Cuscuta europaea TaxID=41803 RepID=A0A9P1E0S2_CUSEU|nr:unnamed protein product [Cuscuta europaea]
MASLNLHAGAATDPYSLVRGNRAPLRSKPDPLHFTPISKRRPVQRVYATCSPPCDLRAVLPMDRKGLFASQDEAGGNENKIAAANLDRWMRGSVGEIVKNLNRAPLLVHVYSEEEDGGGKADTRTERAVVEEWPAVKREWESGERKTPDGLIFVEALREEEAAEEEGRCGGGDGGEADGVSRAWGVVVQGRGAECGPACYLLKTSSVRAGTGMGLFCTHFCLVRVKSFRESAFLQFKNCWLLQ